MAGSGANFNFDETEADVWENEFVLDYAQRKALIPQRCQQSGWDSGSGTVTFTIVQDNGQTTTRGRDGRIVYRNSDQDTVSTDLVEALGAEKIDNFSAFKNSVDQRKIMWTRVANAIERDMDDKIIDELETTTNIINSGTAVTLNAAWVKNWIHSFRVSTSGVEGVATGLLTEAAFLQLQTVAQVSSRDYVEEYKFRGRRAFMWEDILWTPHPRLPGLNTATASCFLFHQSAVGFYEAGAAKMRVGFNDEHLYFFCNGQEWCAAQSLLTDGVWELVHDDTAAFS